MLNATRNTTFALDAIRRAFHYRRVKTSADILAALKRKLDAKEITQKDIASALGVQQPNVSTLFNPVKKTGKPRDLKYDEAQTLIARFRLTDDAGVNATTLVPILQAIVPLAPPGDDLSEQAARALAVALRHALALLPASAATPPTQEHLETVALAAAARYREALSA